MIKALLKKQLREALSLFMRKDKKKNASKGSMILFSILMIYVVVVFFGMFYSLMKELCPALLSANMGWLYFALAAIIATVLAVIGSVFMAQSQLYDAKDNEFLLSMPVPPSIILFSRMFSLYIQNFFFESLVFLPTVIVYFMVASPDVLAIIFCVVLLFLLPVLSLALTCILGWIVALIASHMRNKSIITMILSLGFFVVYFYAFSQLNESIQQLITNSQVIGEKIKGAVYPLYQMGLGAQGDIKGFAIFSAIVIILFAVVYTALAKSFIKIATTKRGGKKIRYSEKALKVSSISSALYKKELSKFLKSPIYMLNCGLGTIMMIIMAGALIIKSSDILAIVGQIPELADWISLIACGLLCMAASTNVVTSPSVSLEGKNLWLVQSLPVTGWQALCAKLKLHMVVTVPVSILCSIVMAVIFEPSFIMIFMLIIMPIVFTFMNGLLGLVFNLKFPKLDWSNETMAVKQSMSVVLTIFAGWGIIAAFVIVYIKLNEYAGPELYALICTVIMAAISALLAYWLKKRGTKIFRAL